MEKKLDGQVIMVTGAGRGLGASFCHVVAAAGASVLALGRDATALNAMLDSLPGSGHEMVIADVTDAAAVAAALAGKRCHAVVNNAGIAATAALHDSPVDEAKNIINTNLLGIYGWCRPACRLCWRLVAGSLLILRLCWGIARFRKPASMRPVRQR